MKPAAPGTQAGAEAPAAAPSAATPRSWRLSQLLSALVVASTLITFVIVGGAVLALRLPVLEDEHRALVTREAAAFAERQQVFLVSIERRLDLLAEALSFAPQVEALLDHAVGDGQTLRAAYVLDARGRVLATGLPPSLRARRSDVLGADLSRLPLLSLPAGREAPRWGDKYLSPLSGDDTVGVLLPVSGQRLLLAEVPLPVLLRMARTSETDGTGPGAVAVWLVDGRGEVMVDSGGVAVNRVNLRDSPLLRPSGAGGVLAQRLEMDDGPFHVAVAHAAALNWTFIARLPAGLHNPHVSATVYLVLAALAATLAVGLALAPLLARRLAGTVRQLVAHAHQLNTSTVAWPQGAVREFNELAQALGTTTGALRQREQELAVIFSTAPVAMAVSKFGDEPWIIAANEAWCRQFGHRLEDILNRPAAGLGIWWDEADRARAYEQARSGPVDMEARLRRADGSWLLCQVSGQLFTLDGQRYMVWANEDITETRRIEHELRELNLRLEERVSLRTQALAQTNADLQGTLDRLQATRSELLRSEKLAALGRLVAGVAHELNTPLGNALMAVSTLRDDAQEFRAAMAGGLRRAALDRLLASIEQSTAISGRNLQRAGELVSGFKQVAADQTSEQRRRFLLTEVVSEILLTLKPSFGRTPYTIEAEVEDGLELDSYPGALGQVLTNLISNAVMHAFEGRDQGRVSVRGRADGDAHLVVEVQDDGVGIAPELIDRIFDPFVTTRMGRGGTGLGLNIALNAASKILGGTLGVRSRPGDGSCFTLRLPRVAPQHQPTPV